MQDQKPSSAGCSACACGIAGACPGYVDSALLNALAISLVISAIFIFLYIKNKSKKTKSKKILSKKLMIISIVVTSGILGFIAYTFISGIVESQINRNNYKKCVESQSLTCEY